MWATLRTTSKIVASSTTRNTCRKSATKSISGTTNANVTQIWTSGSRRMKTTSRSTRVLTSLRARMKRRRRSSRSRMRQIGRVTKIWWRARNKKYEDRLSGPRRSRLSRKVKTGCACSKLRNRCLRGSISTQMQRIMAWVLTREASELPARPTEMMIDLRRFRMKIRVRARRIREMEVSLISNPTHSPRIQYYFARKALG